MLTLSFHDCNLNIVDHKGGIWFESSDIARALGYSNSDAITRLYNRNKDEFTTLMTQTVKLTVSNRINGLQHIKVRIFSLTGAHLLGMFARTQRAKDFRRWVLEVLEKHDRKSTQEERRRLRQETVVGYKFLSHSLQQSRLELGKPTTKFNYMNEAKMINGIVTGKFKGRDRDFLASEELAIVDKMQIQDAFLWARGITDYQERKKRLTQYHRDLMTQKLSDEGGVYVSQ